MDIKQRLLPAQHPVDYRPATIIADARTPERAESLHSVL